VLDKHEKEIKEILERDVEPLKKVQKPFRASRTMTPSSVSRRSAPRQRS